MKLAILALLIGIAGVATAQDRPLTQLVPTSDPIGEWMVQDRRVLDQREHERKMMPTPRLDWYPDTSPQPWLDEPRRDDWDGSWERDGD